MSSATGISVVIPNFNGEALLPLILPGVFIALNNTGLAFEIIVVDDCSKDGSLKMLQEKFPSVRILKNEYNRGFSVTANYG
ncbi:MAG: glycosyltransferase family 2 protein, partial [Chitinophagaceae bacterium]